MLFHKGACICGRWTVDLKLSVPAEQLNPRVCDCDYCVANPSAIISDPGMVARFIGGSYFIRQNGDLLASFYYCESCRQLLGIGCLFGEVIRGAVNSELFKDVLAFGEPIAVQPRLLSLDDKKNRWADLWGELHGF